MVLRAGCPVLKFDREFIKKKFDREKQDFGDR